MTSKEKKFNKFISKNVYISVKLDELNISRKYTGFYYVVVILSMLINGKKNVDSFSKCIYPVVAKKFNKNACTIERNVRVLIDNCWNEDLKLKLNLSIDTKKLSVCKFIKVLNNYLVDKIS